VLIFGFAGNTALMIAMSALNLYVYGLLKIRPLQARSFHLQMCLLLQLCFCFEQAAICCFYVGTRSMEARLQVWFAALLYLYWLLDLVVHSIFAFKYWDLARKVEMIYNSKPYTQSNWVFYLLLGYCIVAIMPFCYECSNINHIMETPWLYSGAALLSSTTAWVITAMIGWAFSKMQSTT
jgi:hypothetical protein